MFKCWVYESIYEHVDGWICNNVNIDWWIGGFKLGNVNGWMEWFLKYKKTRGLKKTHQIVHP